MIESSPQPCYKLILLVVSGHSRNELVYQCRGWAPDILSRQQYWPGLSGSCRPLSESTTDNNILLKKPHLFSEIFLHKGKRKARHSQPQTPTQFSFLLCETSARGKKGQIPFRQFTSLPTEQRTTCMAAELTHSKMSHWKHDDPFVICSLLHAKN